MDVAFDDIRELAVLELGRQAFEIIQLKALVRSQNTAIEVLSQNGEGEDA